MRFARYSEHLTKAAGFKDKRSKIGLRADGTPLIRLAGADMRELRAQAMYRDNFTCVDCGMSLPVDPLELSHDIRRGRGGSDVLVNVHMRCRPCHRKWDNNQPKFGPQAQKVEP